MEMTEMLYNNPFDDLFLSWQANQKNLPLRKTNYPGFGLEPVGGYITSNCSIMASFIAEYSSPFIVCIRPQVVNDPISISEPPVQTQVRSVLRYFGLSKSDLAKILGITRPTLYAWLDGNIEPKSDNISRLLGISSIIEGAQKANSLPLFHAYVERPVSGYPISLIEALSELDLDVSLVRVMVARIRAMTEERNIRIGKGDPKIAKASPSASNEEQILEDNLIAIGPGD